LAYRALEVGGNMPCTLNASNEVAVDAFLKEKVNFLEIAEINEKCLEKIPVIRHPGYDDYIQTDKETRIIAHELIS
jgi:1-deoxy-D-xylulose-5-phosphate reductoisomerase